MKLLEALAQMQNHLEMIVGEEEHKRELRAWVRGEQILMGSKMQADGAGSVFLSHSIVDYGGDFF